MGFIIVECYMGFGEVVTRESCFAFSNQTIYLLDGSIGVWEMSKGWEKITTGLAFLVWFVWF
jgi:hypothetical protein